MANNDYQSQYGRQFITPFKWAILILFTIVYWMVICSQVRAAALQDYIDEALSENLALKQKRISYEKSRAALAEARGAYLPSIDISARYSRAGGGRTIVTPVGDLVNPIHGTLNQLLGEQRFPTDIPNVTTPLLREEEQETKITLTQPLFQAEIFYNQRSQLNMSRASEAERDRYARELVADVKTAYFSYIRTLQVMKLLEETEELLKENLRVSESLVKHDKATMEAVHRAQAELSDLTQQQAEAERIQDQARAYFNFLLNRPLTTQIELGKSIVTLRQLDDMSSLQARAQENRDELRQFHYTQQGLGDLVNLSKAAFLPEVFLAIDYGIEGEEYRFDTDNDFWMASVGLKWNLFNGFQDKSRIRQYELKKNMLQARQEEVRKQIGIETRNAYHSVQVAARKIEAAADRLESARASFKIVESKFAEGMSPQIEYLDARANLTNAEINYISVQQEYRIALAELERVTGSYPLNPGRFDNE